MDTVIKLVRETYTQDDYGVWKPTSSEKEVFCKVESVTRAEFFGGGRNGLNPQYKITMFDGDYEGEPVVLFESLPYSVYRTFHSKMDEIELYVERKGGSNAVTITTATTTTVTTDGEEENQGS